MTATAETELLATELANSAAQPANLRRNGKIARLPKETRDVLNRMLDDGLPYHVIIDELGEAGQGLNAQNITNWVHGGYQDYLKHQATLASAKAQVELAIDLLREIGEADITEVRRACNYLAALQLFQAMRNHGDGALKHMFQATPAKYLHVIHALCHQSNSALKVEKHRLDQKLLAVRTAESARPSSQIKPNQGPAKNITGAAENGASNQIKVNQAPAENSAQVQTGPNSAISHPATPSLHHSITP